MYRLIWCLCLGVGVVGGVGGGGEVDVDGGGGLGGGRSVGCFLMFGNVSRGLFFYCE